MSALVIVLLVALWTAILLPAALRARRQRQPLASADGFARSMTALAGGQPSPPRSRGPGRAVALLRRVPGVARLREVLPPPTTPAARRRRAILTGLVVLLACSVLLGAVAGGPAWILTGVSGAALAVYLGLVFAFVTSRVADAGGRGGDPAPSSAVSAARAAAVRAAVARAPVGEAPPVPGRGAHPGAVGAPNDATTHAGGGATAAVGGPAAAGARAVAADAGASTCAVAGDAGASTRAVAGDARASASLPRINDASGNAGLVSIRTLPRAGG